jgi:glycosyltransferase involved in cell wall biosynthesis
MWASAIHILLTNAAYREALTQRAIAQAQRFSWRTTAERTWKAYLQAAGVDTSPANCG